MSAGMPAEAFVSAEMLAEALAGMFALPQYR
jgi:hypothetical protein